MDPVEGFIDRSFALMKKGELDVWTIKRENSINLMAVVGGKGAF